MAEHLAGALVGSVVNKLLTKALQAASLALHHNKYCTELHTLLTRMQPMAAAMSTKAEEGGANSAGARDWVQSLCKELTTANEILQESSKAWKIMSSRRIVSVMRSIEKLVQEAALVGLASAQGIDGKLEVMGGEAREYFETLSAQLASFQQELNSVSAATRKAFLTPVCNYGHSVGVTSVDLALSEITGSADSAIWAAASTLVPRSGAGAASEEAGPKLRRQDSETVFGGVQVVEDLLKVLLSEDEGIRWVGVWATGGAGKTLIAQRLFNSPALQSHFTGGTFWLTVGRDQAIHQLLKALFTECIGRSPAGIFSVEDLKNRLCQELGNRKNAVLFLDDVWSGVLLDSLDVLPAGGMNRIFVTTRNEEVLVRKHAEKRQILMLPVEDSWKLFCWHAFRGADKVLAHLEGVAREIADECKGLPLALKVIGAAFAGKTEPAYWRRSLEKLKKAEVLGQEHEQQLILRLELSLEELPNLHSRLKDCFLYFAAFPEDAKVSVVEDLLDAWAGEAIVQSEDEAFELLGWLIARSLIELQPPQITSYVCQCFMTCKIHDVLRDLARYVLQHKKEPHKRDCLYEAGRNLECFPPEWITTDSRLSVCRLSLSFNSLTELPQQLRAPDLQVLLLRDNPLKDLPRAFFESFRSLKVLDLRKTLISKLPSMLGHNLKQLVSLNLSSCINLETIPDSTGEMRGLQRLDLSQCFKLSSLPSSLSKLTGLQILNLLMSFKVWDDKEPSPSCTCTVSGPLFAKKRAALKDVSRLSSLNRLRICSARIENFSLNLNSLKKLGSLEVCFEKVESLPEVGELQNLESLTLKSCKSLSSLPSSLEMLASLITLDLSLCKVLSTLPALDQLPQLQVLNLTECSGLKNLPSSFACAGAFPALKELRLKDCRGLVDFPALKAGAMPQLALLSLSGWDQLTTSLPQPLQQLNKLCTLDAGQCIFLQSLDGSLDLLSLSSLEELDIRNARALSSLPASLASLPSLKVLNIRLCSAALHIPKELVQLEAEKRLKIIR